MATKRDFTQFVDTGIDIDEGLRGKRGKKVEGASESIKTDERNLMDNWFRSSKLLVAQKASGKDEERGKWEGRKRVEEEMREGGGRWVYGREGEWRVWSSKRGGGEGEEGMGDLSLSDGEVLGLVEGNGERVQAEVGEKELSGLYWRFWAKGKRAEFLEGMYDKFAVGGKIPEVVLWRIFRCRVNELLASEEQWEGVPDYIKESPDTIWHVGKCMFILLTKGRFWDDEGNAIKPVEVLDPLEDEDPIETKETLADKVSIDSKAPINYNGTADNVLKFGVFKEELQKTYSRTLFKWILACLTVLEANRPSKVALLEEFDKVFAVYAGTYVPPVVDESLEEPYISKNRLIPKGLNKAEGKVYETLFEVLKNRRSRSTKNNVETPHVVTITDLAKDYDDLMAMMVLKELHRIGIIHIEGFVANLFDAKQRALFGRGALNSLKLPQVKIGIGSVGDPIRKHQMQSHEFAHTETFIAPANTELPDGQALLKEIFQRAQKNGKKLTLLTISSLNDIGTFLTSNEDLLANNLQNAVLQGGYSMISGKLTPDPNAANNKFDFPSAILYHSFLQTHNIPSTVWTKVAANALSLYSSLFEYLESSKHPLGIYLRNVQLAQDVNFYKHACKPNPKDRFQPWMDADWYVQFKSTWFAAGHEPDEPYPEGEDMIPYFTKVIAYDALAAVGTAGEDVLSEFGIVKELVKRRDAEGEGHRVVGVLPRVEEGLGEEVNFDGVVMGRVVTALMKGAVLAVEQRL